MPIIKDSIQDFTKMITLYESELKTGSVTLTLHYQNGIAKVYEIETKKRVNDKNGKNHKNSIDIRN